jgi:hypothetical protein
VPQLACTPRACGWACTRSPSMPGRPHSAHRDCDQHSSVGGSTLARHEYTPASGPHMTRCVPR